MLLSLSLGLFLVESVVSLADDTLILFLDLHLLTAIRGLLFFFAMLMAIGLYVLMGLTPMIPKRLFLPVALFNPVAGLLVIPLLIYFYSRMQQIAWLISLVQVVLGVAILRWIQGGLKLQWPLVPESRIEARRFSWRHLSVFLVVNVFILLPATMLYLALCVSVGVGHFSEGFLALRTDGLTVQVRKYVRDDGRMIQLVPMMHIGDPAFYRKLSQSFPSNSVILMEGVSDDRNLLTNKITYQRMAQSLGLAEQQEEFNPIQSEIVPADVDVEQFGTNTLAFMNLVMLVHAKGASLENVLKMVQYTPPPGFHEELLADLLWNRNRHLLGEIEARLPETQLIIVPWGAAHIPQIAREIQKSGFRLDETRDYFVIRFGSAGRNNVERGGESGKPDED